MQRLTPGEKRQRLLITHPEEGKKEPTYPAGLKREDNQEFLDRGARTRLVARATVPAVTGTEHIETSSYLGRTHQFASQD